MDSTSANPHFVCEKCGKPLSLSDAAISVRCADHREKPKREKLDVRLAQPEDLRRIAKMLDFFWGETTVECFGTEYDCLTETNYVASISGQLAGAISLADGGDAGIVVVLGVYPQFQGLGIARGLLVTAAKHFRSEGQREMRVATSNDDIPALCFYQRFGFRIYEVVRNAIAEHHGGELEGFARIPVRDEIRLQMPL